MSERLYRLGKWLFTHRISVIITWIVILATLGGLAVSFQKPFTTTFSIPGTKAQAALDKLSGELPAASKGSGTIVFAAPDGKTILQDQELINEIITKISQVNGVTSAVSPFVSKSMSRDGKVAFSTIQLNTDAQSIPAPVTNRILQIAHDGRSADLEVEVRGDITKAKGATTGAIGEAAGVIIAVLVLLLTFGSLVAAGMPLLIAIIAVTIGLLSVYTATGFITLSSTAPALASMLGLAVGIDYSLFLIVRYIKYVKEGVDPKEASGRMVATAGNAVIFAALTVIIALSALAVVGIPFLATMGLFAALTVGTAALAAITLVPAILSFAKYKVFSRTTRAQVASGTINDEDNLLRRTLGFKWVSFVVKRPILVALVAVVVLIVLALPATKLYLGLPSDSSAAKTSTERKAYDLLSAGFGPGFNGPLLVVADLPTNFTPLERQQKLGEIAVNLKKDSGVALAVPAAISPSGKIGILQVYPTTGPNDVETRTLITRLRSHASTIAGANAAISVTGETAVAVDVNTKLADSLPRYLVVVVGLSLIILLAVFRSIVVPIKATAGFLLSILATLGLLVVIFQWGWFGFVEPGPILSFLPILVTGILFGLAMDYQFFLVSGMHDEYVHDVQEDARKAVVVGFAHGAKVVTVAAIIMISVFAGFVVGGDATIKPIGFALAAGVFIDAFIVRMTIVPAVMVLFGRNAWWLPKWLGKIIPNLSIEGDESAFNKAK